MSLNPRLFLSLGTLLLASLSAWAGQVNYTYDELNRLTRVERDDGTIIEYQYDATGNRTSQIIKKGTTNAGDLPMAAESDAKTRTSNPSAK